jgi:hypothetical protein
MHDRNSNPGGRAVGIRSPYDTEALRDRVRQWRAEATRVTMEAMQAFCLDEADRCERRLNHSLSTPVIRASAKSAS